jgi:hypothetical protein
VDLPAVLTAFDEQMRRHPVPGPGVLIEVEERVTRTVGSDGSWSAVVWSDLTAADADEDLPVREPAGVRTALGLRPRPIEAVLAWAGDVAISAGRVEFHEGTDVASL